MFQQLSGYRHGWLSCLQALVSLGSLRRFRWSNRLSFHSERSPIPLSQKLRRSTTLPSNERDKAAPGNQTHSRFAKPPAAFARLPPRPKTIRSADTVARRSRARPSACILPFDAGRHSVRADRTQHMSFPVINRWRFHDLRSPLHPTLDMSKSCTKIVKNCRDLNMPSPGTAEVVRRRARPMVTCDL